MWFEGDLQVEWYINLEEGWEICGLFRGYVCIFTAKDAFALANKTLMNKRNE